MALCLRKHEITPFVATWRRPEIVVPGEVRKDKGHTVSTVREI